MDRASGSGVFARDPDALIDMIELDVDEDVAQERTAWRLEGTLREFKPFPPISCWFTYPVHTIDNSGLLDKANTIGDIGYISKKGVKARQSKAEERRSQYPDAYESCLFASDDGRVTKKAMANYFGIDEKTIARDLQNNDSIFKLEKGIIVKVSDTGQNP
jgi:RecA-family ATPase